MRKFSSLRGKNLAALDAYDVECYAFEERIPRQVVIDEVNSARSDYNMIRLTPLKGKLLKDFTKELEERQKERRMFGETVRPYADYADGTQVFAYGPSSNRLEPLAPDVFTVNEAAVTDPATFDTLANTIRDRWIEQREALSNRQVVITPNLIEHDLGSYLTQLEEDEQLF